MNQVKQKLKDDAIFEIIKLSGPYRGENVNKILTNKYF